MTTPNSGTLICVSAHPDVAKRTCIPSIFYSLAMALAGVLLFATVFEMHDRSATFSMILMVLGSILIIYGVYRLFWKSKENIYLPTGSLTREQSYFFDLKYLNTLTDMVNQDTLGSDASVKSDASGNVRLDVVLSVDNRFAAVQLFRFVPYSYAPVTSVHYYTGADAALVSAFLARCGKA